MLQSADDPRTALGLPPTRCPSPATFLEGFKAHILRFTAEVTEPILLNEHKGSALRGAFFQALGNHFCHNRGLTSCHPCALRAACPICTLVATVDDAGQRGGDPPRPFVVDPPLEEKTLYQPGEKLEFGLTLFGDGLKLFPYVVVALQEAGRDGLGKRVGVGGWGSGVGGQGPENERGRDGYDGRPRRGRFAIRKIEAVNPLTGQRKDVKSEVDDLIRVPNVPVTHENVVAAIEGRREDELSSLTLHFFTPVRLIDGGRLVRPLQFRPLIQRLFERLSGLAAYYGPKKLEVQFVELLAMAEQVSVAEDRTRWVELESYSARQRRTTPMGGLVGEITFAGDLAPFLPFLIWGQFTHVGKEATKGNGWYGVVG